MPVTITCGSCSFDFKFEHPSVRAAADLMHVTLTCPNCEVLLKAPNDKLTMEPLMILMTGGDPSTGLRGSIHIV